MFLSFFDVKGTILLSTEGINIALTIAPQGLNALRMFLSTDSLMQNLTLKQTAAPSHCFARLTVKVKPHIIPFPCDSTPENHYISAQELDANYQDFLMLDVRNDYEVRVGTFKDAQHMDIAHFTDLPKKLSLSPKGWKKKKIVIFCTGGIRCEKVAPLMNSMGFQDVYQLQGGVIEYFRTSKNNQWHGECFTFDRRVSLTTNLSPGSYAMCFECRAPLSPEEQKITQEGAPCPHCPQENLANCADTSSILL